MRRRVLRTTKVLSIALAVLPACKTEAKPDVAPSTASAAPTASGPPDPALIGLAGELTGLSIDDAMKQTAHFRPLCDAKGYPVVGNLPAKSPGPPNAQPSTFCAEVRKKL